MNPLFPLCVSVTGLNEREMSGRDFVAVKFPGFCLGGGGIDVGNKRPRWLTLSKDTPRAKEERCRWYLRDVFLPALNECRLCHDKFDGSVL